MDSYSTATLAREYQRISTAQDSVIWLHNDLHHAAAVCAKTEDVNGRQRHNVIAAVNLYVELPKRAGAVLSVLNATGDKGMVAVIIDVLDAAGFSVLLDMFPPPAEVLNSNRLVINGHPATVEHDQELNMYRGEFLGLSGEADFYAASLKKLVDEGETSLRVFLEGCTRDGLAAYQEIPDRVLVLFEDEESSACQWMYSPCRALDWKLPAEVSHQELSAVAQQLTGKVHTRHERAEWKLAIDVIMERHGDTIRALSAR
ncbi:MULTISPECIES: type II toxin-antitoxin system HicB family antitoxin [unclassified Leclercia]|uniref:Type II toxin-antitoxin system HicB family antitoxin n=1 Tax=Leclercia barmai TaxID=2785629 RepID=A0ABS7RYV5_9ENTR|nr:MULTISPECIES: type II toxin-antitoxin system HicB family antitoxin [unclassified Leclercia]MBZ0059485.1 type II toxin-antitoxin system HicB family antitoxin [Leclercia sp. EMC7]MCM5697383.1 type II toxin-antitoxin system HicB family antitoxin [Leclercia sp. LTM01]MCM5702023.1 type II toxin-antitoxin system HicB family antitoxin [Leclercia sp. LTM14]